MSGSFKIQKVRTSGVDFLFICLIILLTGLGICALFSVSYDVSPVKTGTFKELLNTSMGAFYKQVIIGLFGIAGLYVLAVIPIEKIRKSLPWLFIISATACLLVFLPGIGRDIKGGHRWLNLYLFSVQPSEIVKPVLVLYLAHNISRKENGIGNFSKGFVPPMIVLLIFCVLIFLENNFSTSAFIFLIGCSVLYLGGASYQHLIGLVIAGIGCLAPFFLSKPHRLERLMVFTDRTQDPQGSAFQINQSLEALSSGGIFGVGIGNGIAKNGPLPEVRSDFIFALIGEETGFVGLLVVILLFVLFAWRGYSIAYQNREDKFCFLTAFGLTTTIVCQAAMNMAVVCGVLPTTGVPLPFFSLGGSSLFITLLICGILINISRNEEEDQI